MRSAPSEVAVLSHRVDLELFISTWMSGYEAYSTTQLEDALSTVQRGGIILMDISSPEHRRWLAELAGLGFDGPLVLLDPQGETIIDLEQRVLITSPPTLSALRRGFEEARTAERDQQRVSRSSRRQRRTWEFRQRRATLPAPPPMAVATSRSGAQPGTGRRRRVAPIEEAGMAPGPRPRRADRRRAARNASLWRRVFRRSVVARSSGWRENPDPDPAPWDTSVVQPAESFREAFRQADMQPTGQRRVATPQGRVRVQTGERLFARVPVRAGCDGRGATDGEAYGSRLSSVRAARQVDGPRGSRQLAGGGGDETDRPPLPFAAGLPDLVPGAVEPAVGGEAPAQVASIARRRRSVGR